MATGWEYYFNFDPYDDADRMVDTDGDGHVNYCEYKWDTNPRDINSFPGQGQLCNPFEVVNEKQLKSCSSLFLFCLCLYQCFQQC